MDQTVDIQLTYYSVTFKRLQHHFINYANFPTFTESLETITSKLGWITRPAIAFRHLLANSTITCVSTHGKSMVIKHKLRLISRIWANIDLTWLVLTRVGLKRVNWEYMIRYVPYRAFTWLRYHSFDYRLKDEPRVVTPIRQSLIKSFIFQR